MSDEPIPRQSDRQYSNDVARSWVIAEMRKDIAGKKQAQHKNADPDDPRAQYVGLIRSLLRRPDRNMWDIEITIGDQKFDISDMQCDFRIDKSLPPAFEDLHFEDGYFKSSEGVLRIMQRWLDKDKPAEKSKLKKYKNNKTGKTFEGTSAYDAPDDVRLSPAVLKRKQNRSNKKKLKKKNQKRGKKK